MKDRSTISPTPKRTLLRPAKLSRGVSTPETATTVTEAVADVELQRAVTCLSPDDIQRVVNVEPLPVAGLPAGEVDHCTPPRLLPFAVSFNAKPKTITMDVDGEIPVTPHLGGGLPDWAEGS